MKFKFKKVYIEITNNCNLSCDFCIKNKRPNKFMSEKEFITILNRIEPYTNYIYLHVLGEPLLHPHINDFITIASAKNLYVNITTNGYLINRIKGNTNIRQLNISLHSFSDKYNLTLNEYLNNIYSSIAELIKNNTKISLRLWTKNKYTNEIIESINQYFDVSISKEYLNKNNNIKIKDNLYLNVAEEFIWPDLSNNYYNEFGKCYGLIDHIGILSSGVVVPCCLDTSGVINLGNIFENDLESILGQERVNNMIDGFRNNKKCEELCKHCNFLNR